MNINGVAKKQMAAPVFTGTANAVRKVSSNLSLNYLILLAEGVGFEPTVRVNVQQISSRTFTNDYSKLQPKATVITAT